MRRPNIFLFFSADGFCRLRLFKIIYPLGEGVEGKNTLLLSTDYFWGNWWAVRSAQYLTVDDIGKWHAVSVERKTIFCSLAWRHGIFPLFERKKKFFFHTTKQEKKAFKRTTLPDQGKHFAEKRNLIRQINRPKEEPF